MNVPSRQDQRPRALVLVASAFMGSALLAFSAAGAAHFTYSSTKVAADTAESSSAEPTMVKQVQDCQGLEACLNGIARELSSAEELAKLFDVFAQEPTLACHSVAQNAAHAVLNAGARPDAALGAVTRARACQGGFLDGIFGWMGTNGGWTDPDRVTLALEVCTGLEGVLADACADGAGNGFMQGSSTLQEALSLCEMFPKERLLLIVNCIGEVPSQAFRATWDGSRDALFDVSDAVKVLEPFCQDVGARLGDEILQGCVDGLSHPLSWGADNATRNAANEQELADAVAMWDQAQDKCSQLSNSRIKMLCYSFVGSRAGWATVHNREARDAICTDTRPSQFNKLCREVKGL